MDHSPEVGWQTFRSPGDMPIIIRAALGLLLREVEERGDPSIVPLLARERRDLFVLALS